MAVGGSLQNYGRPQAQPLLHWAGLRQHGGLDNPRGSGAPDAQLEWVPVPREAQGPVAHRPAAPNQEAGVPGPVLSQDLGHGEDPACWHALSCGSLGTRAP